MTLEDMKKKYTFGFTQKEIEELFSSNDLDKDGRLQLEDFVRIILPPNYVIEQKESAAQQLERK